MNEQIEAKQTSQEQINVEGSVQVGTAPLKDADRKPMVSWAALLDEAVRKPGGQTPWRKIRKSCLCRRIRCKSKCARMRFSPCAWPQRLQIAPRAAQHGKRPPHEAGEDLVRVSHHAGTLIGGKGRASDVAEKTLQCCHPEPFAVILSEAKNLALPLRVNYAKDPGSSREVNGVNYGGSSPKTRAQNDSTYEFFRSLFSPALRDAW